MIQRTSTGSKTMLRVRKQGRDYLWEPLSDRYRGIYRCQRNLYKNICGNKLLFEEHNLDLGLTFGYGWCNSDRFGFVRRAWLRNSRPATVRVTLLDGIPESHALRSRQRFQLEYSTLLDAYKKNELIRKPAWDCSRSARFPSTDRNPPKRSAPPRSGRAVSGATPSCSPPSNSKRFRQGLPLIRKPRSAPSAALISSAPS